MKIIVVQTHFFSVTNIHVFNMHVPEIDMQAYVWLNFDVKGIALCVDTFASELVHG